MPKASPKKPAAKKAPAKKPAGKKGLAALADLKGRVAASPPAVIEYNVSLSRLHTDPANARKHNARNLEAIRASLQENGQVEPLIVQKSSGRIVGGNGRFEAMQLLAWPDAMVAWVDIDDLAATKLGIALNRTGELAEWDLDRLDAIVSQLETSGVDLEGIGFNAKELDDLLADTADDGAPAETAADKSADDAPSPPAQPITQPGDLWLLGPHRLYCGDCLEVLPTLPRASVHLVATDPPYGTTDNDWDKDTIELAPWWAAMAGVAHEGAVYVMTSGYPFTGELIRSNKKAFRWAGVWDKVLPVGHLNAKKQPLRRHEDIVVFCDKAPLYRPQMTEGEPYKMKGRAPTSNYSKFADANLREYEGKRYPTSIIAIPNVRQAGSHPTQKPVDLYIGFLLTHSDDGNTVLDPTAGSGTTIIAAEFTGRVCVAIEKSPAYCDVAVKRWETVSGKKARRQSAKGAGAAGKAAAAK